ncbi:MAG: minor capsid protein [Lysinibacillus sp.]
MSKYWEGRAAQRELESQLIASKYLARMEEQLRSAQADIIQQIEVFYSRYAVDNKISYADAKKYLTAKELKDFRNITLQQYKALSLSGNPEYDRILDAIGYRARISRLEMLHLQIQMQMLELYGGVNGLQAYTYSGLTEVYENSYYKSLYDIATFIAAYQPVTKLTDGVMKEVMSYNWSGKEFSKRIWGHEAKTMDAIKRELEHSFIRGRSLHKTSKAISDATDVALSRAETLVRTEANFFHGLANNNSYITADLDRYQILATLDFKTSDICQVQDKKIYFTKDYKPGVNANPFHARCRTTTVPDFDESEYMEGEQRIARDPVTGEKYKVDGNLTYKEWYKEYVVDKHGEDKVSILKKQIKNEASDKEQFEKYKLIFGKDLGANSFNSFQNLKYNDSNKWMDIKQRKQSVLNTLNYRESFFGKFGDKEVRSWYKWHDKAIPEKLNPKDSLESQAKKAHSLRNQYRTEARLMMSDRSAAERLNNTRVNLTFEELLKHKKDKYQLEGEAAYKDIVRSSQTTNKKVDTSLGLGDA